MSARAIVRQSKDFLRRRFPVMWRFVRHVKYPRQALGKAEAVFSSIHEQNFWEASESRSGPGSTLLETAALRAALPRVFEELGIRTLLDAPCGDFNWMSRVALDLDLYIGADIVRTVVEENRRRFETPRRSFRHLDLLKDPLPRTDAVLCRDCLVHFGDRDVWKAILNFKRSGATWLITTTYPDRGASANIIMGEWQPLNLEAAPFFLPAPEQLIDEQRREADGTRSHKSLGVWRLDRIHAR